jgi:DNA-binding Lrp family transcriptional regulator
MMGEFGLDSIDRLLLDRVQRSFPLVAKPYDVLAEGLGIDGHEVRTRLGKLKEQRIVRQISAIFNTVALGYTSSLVAMAVPEAELDRAAEVVNRHPGVSHNYLRPGRYNLWFTLAVPPGSSLDKVVEGLARRAGGWPTLILPAVRKYKLEVVLDMLEEGEGEGQSARTDGKMPGASACFLPTAESIRIVKCVQEDLPLCQRPFAKWAAHLGVGESSLLRLLDEWIGAGVVRRFAAVLNHRQAGFSANGMVVWRCPEARIEECGQVLAARSEVSHCYHRPSYPEWPYNLYAMVHGRSVQDCRQIAQDLARAIGVAGYEILFSTKEFKKVRLKLFWDESPQ